MVCSQKLLLTSAQKLPLLYGHTLHRYPHLLPSPSQKRKQLWLGISDFSSCVKNTLTLIHQNLSTKCAYSYRTCKTEITKQQVFPKDDNLNVCKTTSTRFDPDVQIRGFAEWCSPLSNSTDIDSQMPCSPYTHQVSHQSMQVNQQSRGMITNSE